MNESNINNSSKQVALWLLLGAGMIVIQVVLGGITRLTESGLSITEWNPITGVLPPLSNSAWQTEFDKYKLTDQFRYVHQYFSLSDFKFIFFWEWFHRLWARLMGVVFLTGFFYFLVKKKFSRQMIIPMVLLFLLGALQGFIGWIMVKSGLLPEKYAVGHVQLATHFIAALILLCYTLWFALSLLVSPAQQVKNTFLKNFLIGILIVLFFQLIYGAFMAGLRAAIVAPTWPDINGLMIPNHLFDLQPLRANFIDNPIMIHFVHRALAYTIFTLIILWWLKSKKIKGSVLFNRLRSLTLVLVTLQVFLGILTVLNATHAKRLLFFGVSHQFVVILLLLVLTSLLFVVRRSEKLA